MKEWRSGGVEEEQACGEVHVGVAHPLPVQLLLGQVVGEQVPGARCRESKNREIENSSPAQNLIFDLFPRPVIPDLDFRLQTAQ